ncbi:MAG: transposase, partial [Anaerolineales bacterium]
VSLNAESGMITNLVVTPGNAYDGHKLPELVNRDLELGFPIDTVAADRGYDDGNNHYFLQTRGLHSAIHLNINKGVGKDTKWNANLVKASKVMDWGVVVTLGR